MFVWLCMAPALAQDVVEFPEGQVLTSIRLRSMGGAATGIAESTSALLLNPAAVAMRRPMAEPTAIDPDLTLQVRDHPLLDAANEIVTGQLPPKGVRRLGYWQIGGASRFDRVGVGVHFRSTSYTTGSQDVGSALWSVGGGYAFDEFVVGVLPHALTFSRGGSSSIGLGTSLGALWVPDGLPLRVGARTRTPMRTGRANEGGLNAARVPGELGLGASYSIGATNVPGEFGPERHQGAWLAPVVVLAADLVVTGGSGKAKAIEPLLEADNTRRSGPTTSLRLGAEGILLHQDLRVRAGTYTLPSRGTGPGRIVGTTGLAYEITETASGLGVRGAGVIEVWADSWSWAVGIESW